MPLYYDSIIIRVVMPPEVALIKYQVRGIIVSEAVRPSQPFDVWVVTPENADMLMRYRGEYRLGIIASENLTDPGFVHPSGRTSPVDMKIHALSGALTRSTSTACRILFKYRDLLPSIERHRDIIPEADFRLLFCPDSGKSETVSKDCLSTEDISALGAFEPYLNMVQRLFEAVLPSLGLGWTDNKSKEDNSLKIVDAEAFAKAYSLSEAYRITLMMKHMRVMALLGSTTLEPQLTALRAFIKSVVDSDEYSTSVPQSVLEEWRHELAEEVYA